MRSQKPAVLITGANSGIGAEAAKYFSARGHDIVLVARNEKRLEIVAKQMPTESLVLPCDLTNEKEVQKIIIEATKRFKHLRLLVNNAGVFERGSFEKTSSQVWKSMIENNLMSCVNVSKALVPFFKKWEEGSIVNVASTAGLRPVAELSAYATSKAAMIALTQTLALELAPSHIRVNAICPGIVETPIHQIDKLSQNEKTKIRKNWAEAHPLGRAGTPLDVAASIYFLSNIETSRWVTGAILPVDGGISLL